MTKLTNWYDLSGTKLGKSHYLNQFGIWPQHNRTLGYIVNFYWRTKKITLSTPSTPEIVSLSTKILYHRQLNEFRF